MSDVEIMYEDPQERREQVEQMERKINQFNGQELVKVIAYSNHEKLSSEIGKIVLKRSQLLVDKTTENSQMLVKHIDK